MEPAIHIDNLTRHFDDIRALDGISLEVAAGEVFGFLGHNGAGKTTTVRLLNGVLTPTSGSMRVLGLDPVTEGADLRRQTGILTESPSVDERLSARENLSIYAALYDVPESDVASRVQSLLARFELSERADDRVSEYSKGMKQRLALARALIHRPRLVFLDEPTSGLDPVAARRVHELIEELTSEGSTVFLCTHNLTEAQRLCDRVAVLERGKILALGTPADLSRRYARQQRLSIQLDAEHIAAAQSVLDGIAGLTDIEPGDDAITFSGAKHDQVPDIVAAMVAQDVRIYRLTAEESSLEDVYFALHGEEPQEEVHV